MNLISSNITGKIGARIREFREKRGMTQAEVAKKIEEILESNGFVMNVVMVPQITLVEKKKEEEKPQ